MKRLSILIVVTLVILVGLGLNSSRAFVWEGQPYAYRSDNLLRLHILASSSSPDDQYLKRQVRDLILHETNGLFKDVQNVESAVEATSTQLPTLQRRVEEYLRGQGKKVQVRMELGRFDFPTRTYGDVTLPAGEYQALRIVLGEGEGNNWWCVLFPPLCLDDEKQFEGMDERQAMALVYKNPEQVQIEYRFKLLEKLHGVPQWVKTNYLDFLRFAAMSSNGASLAVSEEK